MYWSTAFAYCSTASAYCDTAFVYCSTASVYWSTAFAYCSTASAFCSTASWQFLSPLLTSPVHGGGTPSPRAGRVGVGAFKAQGVTIPEKCAIIGIAVRWRGRVAETQLKEDER